MDQELALLILLITGLPTLVALFIVLEVLFRGVVERTRQVAEEVAGRSFVVGLVNGLFLGAVTLALFALGESSGSQFFNLLGLLVLAVLTLGVTFGLSGMVQLIGARLSPEGSELRRTTLGAVALILACLTPFVGWFGLLPYVALHGLGGFVIARFRR
jgi:hypothetical protein